MKKTYSEQLKDPRWQKKRLEIFERDGWKCTNCLSENNELHIHHLQYNNDKLAWEYDNKDLITLCRLCHESDHHKIIITENNGCLNPQEILDNFPEFNKYFSEIGNHEGWWTLLLRKNVDWEEAEEIVYYLIGYAYFDDVFEVFTPDKLTSVQINQSSQYYNHDNYKKGISLNKDFNTYNT